MKNVYKIVIILLIVLSICTSNQCVYAIDGVINTGIRVSDEESDIVGGSTVGAKLGLGDINNYKATGTESTQLKNKIGVLLSMLSTLGSILSVIVLVVMGIKYMMTSVEEKATFKKSMIPYIIGVAILFAGTYLPQFIYGIVQQLGWI